jgi:purine-nucleoside phosphorylase
MESFQKKVNEATQFVKTKISKMPSIGLLAGTGLGNSVEAIEESLSLEYSHIPHFPVSTVTSHRGRLLFGKINGKVVIAMQGRFHCYEGYDMEQITLPIRVMQLLGVKALILSNASGGINPSFATGDIMVITDHINLTGNNPLVGPNVEAWGPRFPDMNQVYEPALIALAEKAAEDAGFGLQKGVYVGLVGPSLETPAEIRFLRTIGADAVGLSTIPEVIAAVHGGMSVLGLSVISNMHLPDNPQPCQVDEIIATAEAATPRLKEIIDKVIEQMPGS